MTVTGEAVVATAKGGEHLRADVEAKGLVTSDGPNGLGSGGGVER